MVKNLRLGLWARNGGLGGKQVTLLCLTLSGVLAQRHNGFQQYRLLGTKQQISVYNPTSKDPPI